MMNFKIWLEYSDQEIISKAMNKGFQIIPVWHRSKNNFHSFDLDKASKTAILGPAIYLSLDQARWRIAGEENSNRSFLIAGNILDLTQPLNYIDTKIISDFIGRQIETIPTITLEKRFGSVSQGLKQMGYDGAWHLGPGGKKDLAMFNPNLIKSTNPNTYDDQGNLIPIEKRFDTSINDVRY